MRLLKRAPAGVRNTADLLSRQTSGGALPEYGVLIGVMVLGTVLAVTIFGKDVRSYYTVSADVLENPDKAIPGEITYVMGPPPEPDMNAADPYGHADGLNFLYGTPYADVLLLSSEYDGVFGSSGDDLMKGTSAGEIFIGGPGNDTAIGARGPDTYVYAPGDGQLRIDELGGDASVDVLDMREFALSEITLDRPGSANIRFNTPDGGGVTLLSYYRANDYDAHLERVVFSDTVIEGAKALRDFVVDAQKSSDVVWATEAKEDFFHTVAVDGSYSIHNMYEDNRYDKGTLTFTDADPEDVRFSYDGPSPEDLTIETADGDIVTIFGQMYQNPYHGVETIAFEGTSHAEVDFEGIYNKAADDMKASGTVTGTRWTEDFFHDMAVDGSYRIENWNISGFTLETLRILNATPEQVRFENDLSVNYGGLALHFEDGDEVFIYRALYDPKSSNKYGIGSVLFEGDPSTTSDDIFMDRAAIVQKIVDDGLALGFVEGVRGREVVRYLPEHPLYVDYRPGYDNSGEIDTIDLSAFDMDDVRLVKDSSNLRIYIEDDRQMKVIGFFTGNRWPEEVIFGDGAGGTITRTREEIAALFD